MTKILIIDDEKDFLDLLKEQLELAGYSVTTAMNGEEGLISAQVSHPDLVICDVRMPKKDGFEVLRQLKKDPNFQAPFIMLTAVDDFDRIREAYNDQADFYVTKPVNLEKLLKNIRTLLNLKRSSSS